MTKTNSKVTPTHYLDIDKAYKIYLDNHKKNNDSKPLSKVKFKEKCGLIKQMEFKRVPTRIITRALIIQEACGAHSINDLLTKIE